MTPDVGIAMSVAELVEAAKTDPCVCGNRVRAAECPDCAMIYALTAIRQMRKDAQSIRTLNLDRYVDGMVDDVDDVLSMIVENRE